jgi:hypothetical protein
MLRILAFLFIITFLNSCHHCICASSDGLRLGMISFSATEIDTIITRKFSKGSNFSSQIDSTIMNQTTVMFNAQNDTFQMGSWRGDILLSSKYDYQIFIPAVNRTINIIEINEPQLEGDCRGKVMCGNIITSVRLNGDLTPTTIQNDILYLKK